LALAFPTGDLFDHRQHLVEESRCQALHTLEVQDQLVLAMSEGIDQVSLHCPG
jgi:hypothetical protein